LQWSPFQDKLLASSSDDSSIKLWVIEDGEKGLSENITECDMEFDQHAKKCKAIQWHPYAEHLMASYAEDNTVRLWDVNQGENVGTYADLD